MGHIKVSRKFKILWFHIIRYFLKNNSTLKIEWPKKKLYHTSGNNLLLAAKQSLWLNRPETPPLSNSSKASRQKRTKRP